MRGRQIYFFAHRVGFHVSDKIKDFLHTPTPLKRGIWLWFIDFVSLSNLMENIINSSNIKITCFEFDFNSLDELTPLLRGAGVCYNHNEGFVIYLKAFTFIELGCFIVL